jgi:hypothetical protein
MEGKLWGVARLMNCLLYFRGSVQAQHYSQPWVSLTVRVVRRGSDQCQCFQLCSIMGILTVAHLEGLW